MWIGILCCILAGIANTLNRVLNAQLVERSGFYSAMTFSFFTGTIFAFAAHVLSRNAFVIPKPLLDWKSNWVVIGVVPSVFTCLLFTLVAAKIPAFYHSVLICVGQVVTAAVLDHLLRQEDSIGFFVGAALIIAGIVWNVMASRQEAEKDTTDQAPKAEQI